MRWPLQRRLFVTVSAGAAALALVMSLLVDRTVVREIQQDENEGLEQTRAAFEALQDYRNAQLRERCRLVSELPYFKAAAGVYDPTLSAGDQLQALATVTEVGRRILQVVDVDLLVLTDAEGAPIVSVGPALERGVNDLAPLTALARAATRNRHAEGIVSLSGGLVQITAVAVEVGGLQLGSLCLGQTLDSHLADSLERMTGSAVALLDRGRLLARSVGVPAAAEAPLAAAWQGLASGEKGRADPTLIRIGGDRYRTLWAPLAGPEGDTPGAFVVLRSEDRALAFLSQVRDGLAGIALVAVLLALVFSYLFARHLTRPIARLVRFTHRVAEGDLQARVAVDTADELGVLGDAFNRMTVSLAESRSRLEEINRDLEERGRDLESANRELRQSKEETEAVNRALEEAHAQLIQAGKMAAFGELGAGLAHELRQPLTAIRGFAQLVANRLGPGEAASRRQVDLIVQAVDHMTGIIQGLKDFARKSSFELKVLDVNPVVERTCLLLGTQLRSRGVELELNLALEAPAVRGDANQLQQVFTNLIANARDAMAAQGGGRLRVATGSAAGGRFARITVSDTGPGIPEDVLPRIFTSFFTTKPEGEGTGLGLSITQGIVKDHGGRIEVESPPGGGAEFRVLLPAAGQEEVPAAA